MLRSFRRVLADLVFDARYGLRALRRHPMIAVAAVVTLSLGIGALTTIFTLLDRMALRPLPVANADRLVLVETFGFAAYLGRETTNFYLPYDDFATFQRESRTIDGLLATTSLRRVSVSVRAQADVATGELVSGDYFTTLGVRPAAGRLLARADDTGDGAVAVISDRLWRRRFGGDPGVVGASITVNTAPVTVVGVLPRDFFGVTIGTSPDVFLPLSLYRRLSAMPDEAPWVQILGRLPRGTTTAQVASELTGIYRAHAAAARGAGGSTNAAQAIRVRAIPHGIEGPALPLREPLRLLFVAGLAVLLIACANVVNLLLARAEVQRPELNVRTALGASRGRLIRQSLAESALLAIAGGIGGIALASAATRLLSAMLSGGPSGMVVDATVDGRVLGFALAGTLATVLGCGLLPALRARASMTSTRTVSGRLRVNKMLLGIQVALSLVLLAGAALMLQTARNHAGVDGGYDRRNLLTFNVNPSLVGYSSAKAQPFYSTLIEQLRAVPGVRDVAVSLQPPLNTELHLVGDTSASTAGAPRIPIVANAVTPGYFAALRIPLLYGRDFLESERGNGDDPPTVAIISAALAERLFGRENPIGRRITWGDSTTFQVVGVAGNTTYGLLAEARGEPRSLVYLPLYQFGMDGPVTVTLRHESTAGAMTGAARAAVTAIDPAIPVYQMRTFEQLVADSLLQQRLTAGVSAAFAIVAVLLAGIGLYGLMSFVVARHEREIGVRMALGADAGRVLRSTLRVAMTPVAGGLVAGTIVAALIGPMARPFLFDVSPTDPATIVATIAVLVAIALFAALLPARRASRVEPIVVLRSE